jgi:hypothetical protein
MKTVGGLFFIAAILAAQGCSKEAIKRATYGGAQLYGQHQCQTEFSADCPEPDSYEEYQQKRKELQTSE